MPRRRKVGIDLNQVRSTQDAERRQLFFSSSDFRHSIDEVAFRTTDSQTRDSFQNFQLNLGLGTDNALSGSTYGFNPVTRNRTLLEWCHRGSWLAGQAIDIPGDDMTRAGVEFTGTLDVNDNKKLHTAETTFGIWNAVNDTERWARLYGGAIAVILIDGQNSATELRIDSISKGQFKGLLVLDRWQVNPSLGDLVTEMGPNMGNPKFYRVTTYAPGLRGALIHYSRVLRLEGIRLPFNQRMMENLWSISVLERLYDRMVAFDSATQGMAQLIYKSYLRTYKIKDLRSSIGGNPDIFNQVIQYVQMMRRFQGIEGITLLDAEDDFQATQTSGFTGIADATMQLGQQLAGALQIPLVRLFGMSPAGFSATGESDLRNYYDSIKQRQKKSLHLPLTAIYRVMARSEGIRLEDDFDFEFNSLWQLDDVAKAQVAQTTTTTVATAYADGIVTSRASVLRELKQQSRITGVWTSITDEEIDDAENEAPPAAETGLPEPGGEEGNNPQEVQPEFEEEGSQGSQTRPPLRLVRDSSFSLVPGLDVIIENPKGTTRYPWRTQLPAHYGHIRGTEGLDNEEIDCFVGPEPENNHDVYIIEQVHPDTGALDEHKCIIGFPNRQTALRAYQKAFDDGSGAARIGSVTRMSASQFKDWLKQHPKKKVA